MDSVRVMVVDDAADARFLIGLVLRDAVGVELVAEAEGADEALERLEAANPDVALLDARMPVVDGYELTGRLLARRPSLRIAILTSVVDDIVAAQACDAGAHACLSKADMDGLPAAVLALGGR